MNKLPIWTLVYLRIHLFICLFPVWVAKGVHPEESSDLENDEGLDKQ